MKLTAFKNRSNGQKQHIDISGAREPRPYQQSNAAEQSAAASSSTFSRHVDRTQREATIYNPFMDDIFDKSGVDAAVTTITPSLRRSLSTIPPRPPSKPLGSRSLANSALVTAQYKDPTGIGLVKSQSKAGPGFKPPTQKQAQMHRTATMRHHSAMPASRGSATGAMDIRGTRQFRSLLNDDYDIDDNEDDDNPQEENQAQGQQEVAEEPELDGEEEEEVEEEVEDYRGLGYEPPETISKLKKTSGRA